MTVWALMYNNNRGGRWKLKTVHRTRKGAFRKAEAIASYMGGGVKRGDLFITNDGGSFHVKRMELED